MSGFFSAPRRFVTENVETIPDAKGHWYSPRRYDAHLDKLPEVSVLRGLTKSGHLNYTIKRLLILTLREITASVVPVDPVIPVVSNYSVEDYTLYTDTGDEVSSATLQINNIRVSVSGTKLKLP